MGEQAALAGLSSDFDSTRRADKAASVAESESAYTLKCPLVVVHLCGLPGMIDIPLSQQPT
jgi:hypothetical protein